MQFFTHADLKSTKKTDSLTVLFTLLGSGSVKAVFKMLVKLTPGCLFSNSEIRALKSHSITKTPHLVICLVEEFYNHRLNNLLSHG